MTGQNAHPIFSTFMLAVAAGLLAYAPVARADVFEIGNNGQWQQINKKPVAPEQVSGISNEFDTSDPNIPPIRLAAITTVGEPVAAQPSFDLNTNSVGGRYAHVINAAAKQYGISPALVDAVMWQESRYNPNAVSHAGAVGLMQLMPGTARQLGVNPHDPWQNVFGGAAYLRKQLDRFGNNVPLALAAYNAGPGAVIKHGGIPPYNETRNYVNVIMRRLSSQGAGSGK